MYRRPITPKARLLPRLPGFCPMGRCANVHTPSPRSRDSCLDSPDCVRWDGVPTTHPSEVEAPASTTRILSNETVYQRTPPHHPEVEAPASTPRILSDETVYDLDVPHPITQKSRLLHRLPGFCPMNFGSPRALRLLTPRNGCAFRATVVFGKP